MSQVLEVSEGIPVDGRVFEPPQSNIDNEAPLYLAFVGSLIDPQTAKDRPWTKAGGIEVSNPCLRFVKHFLRKGRITPLLKDTHDFIPYDIAKKIVDGEPTQHGYFRQAIPPGYVSPNLPPSRGVGYGKDPSPVGTLVGKIAYPGDQVNGILVGSANVSSEGYRRGIVEIASLKSHPYKPRQMGGMYVDPEIWRIQQTIFPDYPFFYDKNRQPTVLISEVERVLDDAAEHSSLREIIDSFMLSLTEFRDYASTTIQNSHAKMREIGAKTEGYIPRYTAMDLVLLDQLGLQRQDREIRQVVASGGGNQKLENMFEQWLAISLEEKQANLERQKRAGEVATPLVDEDTMKAEPEIEPDPVELPSYDCECGKPFDTARAIQMHKTRWCELREK
jgi:hypothetical protein